MATGQLTMGPKVEELEEKVKSDRTSVEADVAARQRKREKAIADLQRAERGLQNLELRAPVAGLAPVAWLAGGPQEDSWNQVG